MNPELSMTFKKNDYHSHGSNSYKHYESKKEHKSKVFWVKEKL